LQSVEIPTLAGIGVADASSATPDGDELAEVQGAISADPAINAGIDNYVAHAMASPSKNDDAGLYPDGPDGQGFGASQGFAIGATAPEPVSWATMLAGMAAVGGVARRRRAAFAAAQSKPHSNGQTLV
jgi:hypothetical protein